MRWVTKILLRKFILEKPENLLENSCKSPGILNLYLAGHPVFVDPRRHLGQFADLKFALGRQIFAS